MEMKRVNRTTFRLLIGLIWFIGAIVCLVKSNFFTAALLENIELHMQLFFSN